jgi:hypothetical protein
MSNDIIYKGEILGTYFLEKRGNLDGYVFEFEGLEGLEKLLKIPPSQKFDDGNTSIEEIKSMLKSDSCWGIFLSYKQRYLSGCKQ